VAAETVALRMTGDAALQVLSRGLTMVEEKLRLRVVVPCAPQAIPGAETRAHVTVRAELRLVVAIGAGLVARVCSGGMGRQEPGWMVSGARIRRIGAVAIQALGSRVAGAAALGPGGRQLGVAVGEVDAVRGRTLSLHPRARAATGPGGVHGERHRGRGLVAAETALLRVASGALGGLLPRRLPVTEQERGIRVAGWCAELHPEGQGSGIGRERLDRRDLWSVDVTLAAEVACVTDGAGGCDAPASRARLLTVTSLPELGSPVRGRGWESAHVGAGEADRLDEGDVANDARGIRCLQVGGADVVAVEAVPHHGLAYLHGIGTGLRVTGAAPDRGIRRRPQDPIGMARMRELQVAGAWGRRRRPLHPLLDGAVVAVGAVRRLGPERGGGFGGARVASHAGGEELAMLPVVEAVLRYPCQGGAAGKRGEGEQKAEPRSDPHRLPARGRVRKAGGRRNTSASLRRRRVTRAWRRVWPQSNAAASGRSRVSQYRAPPTPRRSRFPRLHSASIPTASTEASLNRNSSGRSRVEPYAVIDSVVVGSQVIRASNPWDDAPGPYSSR